MFAAIEIDKEKKWMKREREKKVIGKLTAELNKFHISTVVG